jgi:hypothetical protein
MIALKVEKVATYNSSATKTDALPNLLLPSMPLALHGKLGKASVLVGIGSQFESYRVLQGKALEVWPGMPFP